MRSTNINNHKLLASGLHGLVCAGFATGLMALLSWTFVAATNNTNWMGSDTLASPPIELSR